MMTFRGLLDRANSCGRLRFMSLTTRRIPTPVGTYETFLSLTTPSVRGQLLR